MKFDIVKFLVEFTFKNAFKYRRVVKWVFVLIVTVLAIFLYSNNFLGRLELMSIDYHFMLRPSQVKPSNTVFIDMAEDSIEAIGRWPWPRKWHATLVTALSEYGAKVIAFDVIFSEPQDEVDDFAFEASIRQSRVVYLPLLYNLGYQDREYLYDGHGITSVYEPLMPFRKWIEGTGHINAIPDSDGILRRTPPIINYEGKRTYQLAFKIGCDLLGVDERNIIFYSDKNIIVLKRHDGKNVHIALDSNNQLIVNWLGKWGKVFDHYSYIDVIRSYAEIKKGEKPLIDLNVFKDKICIVGLTAAGLTDIKPIPIENAYPAVGANAMIMSSVINNDFVYDTPEGIDLFLICLVSIAVTLYLFGLRPLGGMLFALGSIIGYIIISIALFDIFNVLIITFYPLLSVIVSYGLTASYTYLLHSIERVQLFTQATRDGLTLLYNVRHFNILLEAEFKNISLYKARRLSLIMIDIDNFKQLNDTYGHPSGDTVLKEVANILQSKCRQIDVVARYGGEEFIIMLVGSGKGWALGIAEKIRTAVETTKFNFKNEEYSTTISLGVVEYSEEKTKEELIEKADKALYKAKRDGKNRVCEYSASV